MDRKEFVINAYNTLRLRGICHTQKDFANLLGFNPASISKAFNGDDKYLTDNLIKRIEDALNNGETAVSADAVKMFTSIDGTTMPVVKETIPVIPTDAMAGTLGEFAASISNYDCERMVSPIAGADYAMKVCGESMSPEYPNGSTILIKKINEKAFIPWNNVFVLDTCNGAIIKQVRKTDKENVVECVSINPDFQPFTIDTSYINGWYRVLMVLSMK